MSRTPKAINQLPPATLAALEKLGADLAVARLRRKESLASWAKRMGVSISTLQRLEAGDPTISVGIVASALWLMSRDGALGELAAPANDRGAMELEVREAEELGRARARASQEARVKAAVNKARGS
ncbi:DNA-binding protein [Acidovorax carolinensis]|nr:DNA-binding protein [Acidovorax carolinensis]